MKSLNIYINEMAVLHRTNRFGNGPKPNITDNEINQLKEILPEGTKFDFMKAAGNLKITLPDNSVYTIAKYDDEHKIYPSSVEDDAVKFYDSEDIEDYKKVDAGYVKWVDDTKKSLEKEGLISVDEFPEYHNTAELIQMYTKILNILRVKYGGLAEANKGPEMKAYADAMQMSTNHWEEYVRKTYKPVHGWVIRKSNNSGYNIMFKTKNKKWPEDVLLSFDDFKEKLKNYFTAK